tara:strand:- start:320 stop:1366 length:1047 start_codon:yes stop_codon:yes gene_type:complete
MNDHASLLCHVNLANGFRGGERQTLLLVKALSERGFKQKLIARKGSELVARSQSISGINVIEKNMFAFDAFSEPSEKTLFHFHDSRSFPMFYLNGLFKSMNYIYTRRVQRPPKVSFMSKKIYTDSMKIVCLSSSIENTVKELFGKSIDSVIIPSAYADFDYEPEKSLEIRQEIKQDFLVGHIGSLDDSHKGQSDIIQLATEAMSKELDIGFVMVGSGRDEFLLKEESKDLENVYFTGQVENIGDYLSAFDVFIFPSRHEGLGSTLLDAIHFGLPVIARDVGGISDIIEHGINGFMVSESRPDFFTPLVELYENETKRQMISKANREKSKEFSIERMTESYISLYNQLL